MQKFLILSFLILHSLAHATGLQCERLFDDSVTRLREGERTFKAEVEHQLQSKNQEIAQFPEDVIALTQRILEGEN